MNDVSRRRLLQLLSAGAGAMALGGGSLLASGPAWAARAKELNILCWEGYNSAQVLDPFRASTGATVKAESLTNDPTMINRLRAGETKIWDLINVNNPWARKVMAPAGLIKPLPRAEFEPYFDAMLPEFKAPYKWAMSEDGKDLLGMAQRFGPFNYVVNTGKISRKTAEDIGWDLFNDKALAGKYGIQESDDWNVFDIFLVAGINPFVEHTPAQMDAFKQTAIKVFKGAKMVGDVASLNQAMISGEIDLYMTGGTYTASPARADGYPEIRGITPLRGPIDGKGGVSWIEITSGGQQPGHLASGHRLPQVRAGPEGRAHRGLRRGHLQPGEPDGQSQVLRAVQQGRAGHHPVGQPGRGNGPLRGVRHRARLRPGAGDHHGGQAHALGLLLPLPGGRHGRGRHAQHPMSFGKTRPLPNPLP
jgi:spermidine/putrescine transport system substrate-binding protein